jgi:uncharacterized repeat protein (TIGR03803 family)
VLYSFDFRDGAKPLEGVINVKGTLYGTTSAGGEYDCYPLTCGTAFSITTVGKEKVLHSFGKGADGVVPVSGLIDVGGTFYGTTERGRCVWLRHCLQHHNDRQGESSAQLRLYGWR